MPELYQNARRRWKVDRPYGHHGGLRSRAMAAERAIATDTLAELIARIFANPPAGLAADERDALRALVGVDERFSDLMTEALTGNTETGADLSFLGGKLNDRAWPEPAPTQQELIYYGRHRQPPPPPPTVDVNTLSSADATVAGHDISIGPSHNGGFFVILVPATHAILTLINTGLNVDVLATYTRADNVRMLGSPAENYHAYTLGPLNPGLTVNYRLTLTE